MQYISIVRSAFVWHGLRFFLYYDKRFERTGTEVTGFRGMEHCCIFCVFSCLIPDRNRIIVHCIGAAPLLALSGVKTCFSY